MHICKKRSGRKPTFVKSWWQPCTISVRFGLDSTGLSFDLFLLPWLLTDSLSTAGKSQKLCQKSKVKLQNWSEKGFYKYKVVQGSLSSRATPFVCKHLSKSGSLAKDIKWRQLEARWVTVIRLAWKPPSEWVRSRWLQVSEWPNASGNRILRKQRVPPTHSMQGLRCGFSIIRRSEIPVIKWGPHCGDLLPHIRISNCSLNCCVCCF